MRKVVSGLFISLDGVVESPDQWQFAFDEEMGAALTTMLETTDAVLLGRVTYTEGAGYWPTVTSGEDAEFANWINNSTKYVVSTTLDNVDDWANSTLIKGDLALPAGIPIPSAHGRSARWRRRYRPERDELATDRLHPP